MKFFSMDEAIQVEAPKNWSNSGIKKKGDLFMTIYDIKTDEFQSIRENCNLTRAELAGFLGVAPTTVTNYESGRTPLPLRTFLRLCSIYQLDPNNFIVRATISD